MKQLITLALIILIHQIVLGQSPYQINYQGVARDQMGTIIGNQDMKLRISIFDQNPNGPLLYTETKKVKTNKFGLFNTAIGSNTALLSSSGNLQDISWGNSEKYIGIEIDPENNNDFLNLGVSPMLSVPYSFYAFSSKDGVPSPSGKKGLFLSNDGYMSRWDSLPQFKINLGKGLKWDEDRIAINESYAFNASKILNYGINAKDLKDGSLLYWNEADNSFGFITRRQAGLGLEIFENTMSIKDTAVFNASKILDFEIDTSFIDDQFVMSWDKTDQKIRFTPRLRADAGLVFSGNTLSLKDTAIFNASKILDKTVDISNLQDGSVMSWDESGQKIRFTPRLKTNAGLVFSNNTLSLQDTALFNASKILDKPINISEMQDGFMMTWDEKKKEFHFSPQLQIQEGLRLENNVLSIKDTALFNASKILNTPVSFQDAKHNDVLTWDSVNNVLTLTPLEEAGPFNDLIKQDGNSLGQNLILGTKDNFGIDFKINDSIIGSLKPNGMFSTGFLVSDRQFLSSTNIHPIEPITLSNNSIAYNGEVIPPYSFTKYPKTGLGLEETENPALSLIHNGRPMIRVYWEEGIVDNAAVIQGLGQNRLSIQSASTMVHIADNNRYEWEGKNGDYIHFVGYRAASYKGLPILFTTEQTDPATPLAIMPYGGKNALQILDTTETIRSFFDSRGWLNINTPISSAPLHIGSDQKDPESPITVFENMAGDEVFSTYNTKKSFFGDKAYYRVNPKFASSDSNALVSKRYVDEMVTSNTLNTLVDPENTLSNYTLTLPAAPKDGLECYYFFGGKIESGNVVNTLSIDSGNMPVLLSVPLPQNVPAGSVIAFKWFAASGKWYRKL